MTQPNNAQDREPTVIQRAVEDYMKRRAALIETYCEAAIQSGGYGVLVINSATSTEVRLSADVPYGQIHERDAQ